MTAQALGVVSPQELSAHTSLRALLPEQWWKAIANERVTDLDIDEYGRVFVKASGKSYEQIGEISDTVAHSVASTLSAWENVPFDIDRQQSIKTTWPGYGFRTVVKVPPAVAPSPTVHVRTKWGSDLDFSDLVSARTFTANQALHVESELLAGRVVLIAGLPGSGKTTTQRACTRVLEKVPWLVYIVDPLDEIDTHRAPNLRKVKPNKGYSPLQALDDALLCDPGAIGYGEVRTGDAGVYLVRTWLSGVWGPYCTIHTDDGPGVIPRFADFYREQNLSPVYGDFARLFHNVIYMKKYTTDFGARYVADAVLTVSTTIDTPQSPADFVFTKID